MIRKIFLVGAILFLITFGVYTYPVDIKKELPAIKYRLGDEEYFESTTIKIEGTYHRKIFSKDIYKGKICIEGYDFTNESSIFTNLESTLTDIEFDDNGYGLYRYIRYNPNEDIERFLDGEIFIEGKFSSLTMVIVEKKSEESDRSGWSSKDGLMISAPAKARKEALDVSNKLMREIMRGVELK